MQHAFEVDAHGLTIRGMAYYPERTRRSPAVLFLHGFTGQRMESGFLFVRLARALVARGIAAAAFDFRHSGESDGDFAEMLVSGELDDALRMTQWLQGQPFADRSRLAVLGFSLGGLLAACLSARVPAPGFRGRVLLAPTTVANLMRWDRPSGGSGGPGGAEGERGRVAVGSHTLHPRFFEDLRTLDPLADIARHPRPTLLVQGTGDTAVPPAISEEYAQRMRAAGVPLTAEMIPDADHVFTRVAWQRRAIEVVADWLAATLR